MLISGSVYNNVADIFISKIMTTVGKISGISKDDFNYSVFLLDLNINKFSEDSFGNSLFNEIMRRDKIYTLRDLRKVRFVLKFSST